jgi:hypothetical protein
MAVYNKPLYLLMLVVYPLHIGIYIYKLLEINLYVYIMKIKSEKSYAIVGTTICDIHNREMRQMHELNNRIKNVLNSHKGGSEKKEYISDDDLTLMHAILSVFTKEWSSLETSAFDDYLKELNKPVEPEQKDDEPEVII